LELKSLFLSKLNIRVLKIQSQNIADALSRLIGKTGNSGKEENIEEEYIRFVAKQATPKSLTTREIEEFSRYDEEIGHKFEIYSVQIQMEFLACPDD
jgi:hypothetical protein